MHLLHSCPIIIPQFASLTLLINSGNESVHMYGEMMLVASPLATTPQRTVLDNLSALHNHLARQIFLSNTETKIRKNTNSVHSSQKSTRNLSKTTPKSSTTSNETSQNTYSRSNHIFNTVQVYRAKHGIGLYYIMIQESDIVNLCSSLIMQTAKSDLNLMNFQQSNSKSRRVSNSGKVNKKGSSQETSGFISNFSPNNARAAVLCIGLNGVSFAYASSTLLNTLPRRMNESFLKISRLRKKLSSIDEMRQQTKSLLSALLFEEQELYSNSKVGISFDTSATSTYSVQDESCRRSAVKMSIADMEIMQILSISEKDMNMKVDRKITRVRSGDDDMPLHPKSIKGLPSLPGFDFKSDSKGLDDLNSNTKQSNKEKLSFLTSHDSQKRNEPNPLLMHPSFLKTSTFDRRRRNNTNSSQRRRRIERNTAKGKANVLNERMSFSAEKIKTNMLSPSRIKSATKDPDWTANFNSMNLNNDSSSSHLDFRKEIQEDESQNDATIETEKLRSEPIDITNIEKESPEKNVLEKNAHNLDSSQASPMHTNKIINTDKCINDELSTSTDDTATPSEGTVPSLILSISLNEDLMCSYEHGRLTTSSVEGTVQIKTRSDSLSPKAFILVSSDPSEQLKNFQITSDYVRDVSNESKEYGPEHGTNFRFLVNGNDFSEKYFTVLRYKCINELRPVPIRVQSRTQVDGKYCRVALQISSNPANEDQLSDLTILMPVPRHVKGETLITSPAGGIWNSTKRSVLWRVTELGNGEKFQLQSQFEMFSEEEAISLGYESGLPTFPVLVRCQCLHAQLSEIEFDAHEVSIEFPIEISTTKIRRFRLSHREKP